MQKDRAINCLRSEINTFHGSKLTNEQVEHYVGFDANADKVMDYFYEVHNSQGHAGVTPEDIMDLWLETA